MTDGQTLITVRGEAQRTVDPDRCGLHARVQVRKSSRADALEALAATQRTLTDGLAGLGGVTRTAAADRGPVTWTAGSVRTHVEHLQSTLARKDRIVASLSVTVYVRDFTLLDRVAAIVTGTEDVGVDFVSWDLDEDSPAQREVRADAVHAALQRGRDYAAALGATVSTVEQLADVGLLGGQDAGFATQAAVPAGAFGRRMAGGVEEEPPELVLDPQPQQVFAQVEARLIAVGVDLTAH